MGTEWASLALSSLASAIGILVLWILSGFRSTIDSLTNKVDKLNREIGELTGRIKTL